MLRRSDDPCTSPPRRQGKQSRVLGSRAPRLPVRPPLRSAGEPKVSRAAPLARAAPAAAGIILRLLPLRPSRAAPAAARAPPALRPWRRLLVLPIGPRAVAPHRNQWAEAAGAAPTGQAAEGKAIVDKLAAQRRSDCAGRRSSDWNLGGRAASLCAAPRPAPPLDQARTPRALREFPLPGQRDIRDKARPAPLADLPGYDPTPGHSGQRP